MVRFKGLEAKADYWLWCEDGSIAPTRQTGGSLMEKGLTIRLPQPLTSDIIFVQDASRGRPTDLETPEMFSLGPVKTTSHLLTVSAELNWEPSKNARFYRVTVGETPDLSKVIVQEMAALPSVVIPRLPPVRQLYWSVEAISHGGSQGNRGSNGAFTTPGILAREAAFASDMPWTKATAGADTSVRRDRNLKDALLKINGQPIEKGLWTHAFNDASPADVEIDIQGRGFALFKADAGVEDSAGAGSVQFQVLADGEL
ncbi:MAG: NPCBM/NEW2 domain-containing protein, partial [Verrucomicrobia bacterium]|nr:NPCBM/NEW2 domain-containing protein [Verrucomicrobiota bacterium]